MTRKLGESRRQQLYEEAEGVCHLCGGKVSWEDASIDHLFPLSIGGPDTKNNLALAHTTCNRDRDQTLGMGSHEAHYWAREARRRGWVTAKR